MQTSESFRLSAILSFSGGLQDAYTYNMRNHVFANAQTGNVVLMSQNFMQGDVGIAIQYMFPLIAFTSGICIAEIIENRFKRDSRFHWRQLILFIELVCLVVSAFIPASLNSIANMLISFSCALQVQSFRKVHGYGYASTMCIGNLRSGTESLSKYFLNKERSDLKKALHFYGIILIFAVGAGLGGTLSRFLGFRTILISPILLMIVIVMMNRQHM